MAVQQTPAHCVFLYDSDKQALANHVGEYLAEGLRCGDRCLIIAEPRHEALFLERLAIEGIDVENALERGELSVLGAADVLQQFLIDGKPDPVLFDTVVGSMIRELAGGRFGGIRAYGEMVGILWREQRSEAAMQLEELWNHLIDAHGFQLFCAYEIDIFNPKFSIDEVDKILAGHSHFVPSADSRRSNGALSRGIDDVLGGNAMEVRPLMQPNYRSSWVALPEAEATILWLRNNLPGHTDEIISLAKDYFVD